MPPLRLLLFTIHYTYIVVVILSLGEVILFYSYYIKKGLVYIAIVALSSHQPSSYFKCTSINMQLSYNIHLVSNIKYIYTRHISL